MRQLLPILVGVLLHKVDSGTAVLHDPMRHWCRFFTDFEFHDSQAVLDDIFDLPPAEK